MSFWVDTHAHLDGREFDPDRSEVIRRAEEVDVKCIINASSSFSSCHESLQIARDYSSVFVAIGIHPQEIKESLPDFTELEKLISHPKVVAIGETGLDYYWDSQYILNQKKALQIHIELAEQNRLPLVLHSRSSDKDLIEICQNSARSIPLIWHCFSGDEEAFLKALAMDFYFSLGGVMTFPNARRLRGFIPRIPLDRLLLETDSPYLAPQKKRGKRNEPAYLVETAKFLSELLGISLDRLQDQIFQNIKDIFGEKLNQG
ncbi:TatD family hydrolase [Atribacter laminatus]|uniref:Putative metal-dependent hydrolase YcfH n=1 Tax=Atribacter laminatus TaxID=2847778 RepID=A0A7T1AJV5_ATRLM|nr:TatD family hydrolase [Atribacter laminatus]QPM67272.1 putative metal-dependent hydrolase YcfH [Atribacter laminatus]